MFGPSDLIPTNMIDQCYLGESFPGMNNRGNESNPSPHLLPFSYHFQVATTPSSKLSLSPNRFYLWVIPFPIISRLNLVKLSLLRTKLVVEFITNRRCTAWISMQYHQPYSGRGGRHATYHGNRHRTRSATSYNPTTYPSYYHQYFSSNQGINPPPSKRRRAEPSTWHPDSFPRQIGEGSSSGGASGSRPREEEPGFMSRDEIERLSPSRKDGIDSLMEARLRHSYCSYLKNLGLRLAL